MTSQWALIGALVLLWLAYQTSARDFGRDRLTFDAHTCLDLRDIDLKRSLQELVYHSYEEIVGQGPVSSKNITRAEKASARWSHEVLRSLAHGGGYSKDHHPSFIGIIYRVWFIETSLVAGELPKSQCHKMLLLRTSLDFATVIEHVLEPCNGEILPLGYAYGGLGIPNLEAEGIYMDDPSILHLMSYNIWNFEAPYTTRLGKIVHQVLEHNPDILSLQEVRWSNYEHPSTSKQGSSVTDLAKALYHSGYKYWTWRPAMLYQKELSKRTFEGVAVFSKFPLVEIEVTELTRNQHHSDDYHQRIVLRTEIDTPAGLINVFTTHFSLFAPSRDSGCVETRDIMRHYAEQGPVVLMGDFNDEREKSKGIQYLLGEISLAASKGFLQDSFDWLSTSASAQISDTDNTGIDTAWSFTTQHLMPKKRIDFILHDPTHSTIQFHGVVENKLEAPDTVQPSDHRALFVTLKVHNDEDGS